MESDACRRATAIWAAGRGVAHPAFGDRPLQRRQYTPPASTLQRLGSGLHMTLRPAVQRFGAIREDPAHPVGRDPRSLPLRAPQAGARRQPTRPGSITSGQRPRGSSISLRGPWCAHGWRATPDAARRGGDWMRSPQEAGAKAGATPMRVNPADLRNFPGRSGVPRSRSPCRRRASARPGSRTSAAPAAASVPHWAGRERRTALLFRCRPRRE